jgi:hypothetical protein
MRESMRRCVMLARALSCTTPTACTQVRVSVSADNPSPLTGCTHECVREAHRLVLPPSLAGAEIGKQQPGGGGAKGGGVDKNVVELTWRVGAVASVLLFVMERCVCMRACVWVCVCVGARVCVC